jgi:hypothetical protein
MKVKITELHPKSVWNGRDVVGKVFELAINKLPFTDNDGYAFVLPAHGEGSIWCKYIEVPEPSTMSELGKWIDEHLPKGAIVTSVKISNPTVFTTTATASPDCKITVKNVKPKKLSWIQKIRGYDRLDSAYDRVVKRHNDLTERHLALNARCNAAEAMRDHYKTQLESWESLAISKARELELMTKVADNWQQKAIDANTHAGALDDIVNILSETISGLSEETHAIGKRLKFSVGHNHIEIIVGNPITACYFISPDSGLKDFNDEFMTVSICHKNDVFDWKRGTVEALENMVNAYLGNSYGDPAEYYNALFTKYPEIGIQPVVKPVKKTKKAKK